MGAWLGRNLARAVASLIFLKASLAVAQPPAAAWEEQTVFESVHKATSYDVSGERIAVGEPASGSAGVVRTYVRSGRTWSLEQTLLAPDDLECFGAMVALSANTLVVSAPCFPDRGKIFIYTRPAGTWEPQGELVHDDGTGLGTGLALSGDTLLTVTRTPVVHALVYRRSASVWAFEQELLYATPVTGDAYGWFGFALDGDRAVVGAPYRTTMNVVGRGSAFVFTRSGSTWTEQAELPGTTVSGTHWGMGVAVRGSTLLLGGPNADADGEVGVWLESGSSWTQSGSLPTTNVSQVGNHIDFTNDRVATAGNGAVQIFTHAGGVFAFEQALPTPAAESCNECYGTRLSLDGDVIAIKDLTEPSNLRIYAFGPPNGTVCGSDDECVSGHCVDGVCCDRACDSPCDTCLAVRGASEDGTCTIVQGSPGFPACAPLACAGGPECQPCASDDDCPMDLYCTSDSECQPRKAVDTDCGMGDCKVAGCRECQSNLCVDLKCTLCQGDEECQADEYCSSTGSCQPTKPRGAACNLVEEADCEVEGCRVCGEFSCVDGVCCNTPCEGTCEACVEALTSTADGTCAPIPGGADPEDECDADSGYPESCKGDGMCDGERACRALAVEGTACGEPACSGDDLNVAICNSAGACVGEQVACMPFACAANACRSECMADTDCAFGHRCIAGACLERGSSLCSDDGSASLSEGNVVTQCREYLCNPTTGLCRTDCQISADCASGAICDTTASRCLPTDSGDSEQDAGCGCRLGPRPRHEAWTALLLLLGLLAARTRRERSYGPRSSLRTAAHRRDRTASRHARRCAADARRHPN